MQPPRIPTALLRVLLPDAEQVEVLDDLAAEYRERASVSGAFRARVWYWRQVTASVPSLLSRTLWRGRTGFEPRASGMQTGGPAAEQWIMDARHAVRRLIRRPRYAILAILTLALGIGGSAAVFGIARAIFFAPLPYSAPESIGLFSAPFGWSMQEFAFLRGHVPGFSQVAQYRFTDATLELGDSPSQLVGYTAASSELFDVLGARPALGRTFESRDEAIGAEAVAVINYSLYEQLGGTPAVLGTRIRFNGAPTTVIGVMPRGFFFPRPTIRVWVPQQLDPENTTGNYALVGRAEPGMQIDRMAPQLARFGEMMRQRFTYTPQWDKTKGMWVKSIRDAIAEPMRPTLVAVMAAMAMILLIACVNVASLMLGQVEGRAAELAVRAALGASRMRLARQLVAESVVLGVVAGIAGAAIAKVGFNWLVSALPLGAFAETATFDWRVFSAAMVVALATALAISLVPTLSLWRGRLSGSLGATRTQGVAGRGVRLESFLVVAEVSVAVLMVAGAGLIVRSVQKLYEIDPGVRVEGVGVVNVVLPSDLTDMQRRIAFDQIVAGVRTIPGVQSAGMTQRLPLRGNAWTSGLTIEGKPEVARQSTTIRLVSPDYLKTMGIRVKAGRALQERDIAQSAADTAGGVVVINEAFAKKYFGSENPIGRRITSGFSDKMARIVGVVNDVTESDLTEAPQPTRYSPYTTWNVTMPGQSIVFRVNAGRDPVGSLEDARSVIRRISPRAAIQDATTMERILAIAVGPARQALTLMSLLTGLALLLGAIGIYGVMSHFVSRRKRDWGIRIALGLSPARVLGGVVGRGTSLVAMGIVIGLGAFAVLSKFLEALMYGVGRGDPYVLAAAIGGLLMVGVAASLIPAWRASGTDPAVVLREQ